MSIQKAFTLSNFITKIVVDGKGQCTFIPFLVFYFVIFTNTIVIIVSVGEFLTMHMYMLKFHNVISLGVFNFKWQVLFTGLTISMKIYYANFLVAIINLRISSNALKSLFKWRKSRDAQRCKWWFYSHARNNVCFLTCFVYL